MVSMVVNKQKDDEVLGDGQLIGSDGGHDRKTLPEKPNVRGTT